MPNPTGNQDALIDRTDIEITRIPQAEKKEETLIPEYNVKIDLTKEEEDRLRTQVFTFFELLQEQRKPYESGWDEKEAQYLGEMEDNTKSEFSLNVPDTATKIDTLVRKAVKAVLNSDPKFVTAARPESVRKGLEEVAEKQEAYLDYLFDEELPIESPLRNSIFSAALLDVGFIKIPYVYKTKRKKREETYSAKVETDQATGQPLRIPGLEEFINRYPEAKNGDHQYNWVVKNLLSGKDASFISEFTEAVYNNPMPQFIAIRDFWCDVNINSYEELCDAQITIERQRYSFWQLKQKERDGDFINVDKVKYKYLPKENKLSDEETSDWKTRLHEIIEVTYWFDKDRKDGDDMDPNKEVRIICWFHEESETFLGAINYPYHYVESDVIPFWVKDNPLKRGMYKGGIAEDITDMNIAQNAMLNFMLTGVWQSLTVTPIVRDGSPVASQFLEDRWTHGVPIVVPATTNTVDNEVGFLEKPYVDANSLMNILLFMNKYNDDRTGVSSLATGKESPTDPRAPASKTALLLSQTGDNIEDYIKCLLPSFNLIGEICLKLIYQMSKEGRKFRQKQVSGAVVGGDPFGFISRDEMIAKTNIQSQAANFAFNEEYEKQATLALVQLLRGESEFMSKPGAVDQLFRTLIKQWSPKWKNKVDQIWPTRAEFMAQQLQIAVQAIQIYAKKIAQERVTLKKDPEINIQDLLTLITQMQAAAVTPPERAEGLNDASNKV
jgi:hypothetical protein